MKLTSLAFFTAFLMVGCGDAPKTTGTDASQPQTPGSEAVKSAIAEAPPQTPTFAEPTDATKATSTPTKTPASYTLLGSAFKSSAYDPPHIEAEGMQLFQHYGATSATVDLKSPVTRVTAHFTPRAKGDSYPVVYLTAQRTGLGPHTNTAILNKEAITTADPVSREISLEEGTWEITLGFFGSTNETRTGLELHTIKFE